MGPISSRVLAWVRGVALIPLALMLGAGGASAAPILITFESDAVQLIPGNDFASAESTRVHFSDTVPAFPGQGNMFIIDESFSFTNDTHALAVGFDGTPGSAGNPDLPDDSALRIVFDTPAAWISMDLFFGQGYVPQAGDTAVLTAFSGGGAVGSVSADLLTDDWILFDAADFVGVSSFDSVELEYVVPLGLTEIVDNVNVALIPEPHAAILFSVGALLVGAACRRWARA